MSYGPIHLERRAVEQTSGVDREREKFFTSEPFRKCPPEQNVSRLRCSINGIPKQREVFSQWPVSCSYARFILLCSEIKVGVIVVHVRPMMGRTCDIHHSRSVTDSLVVITAYRLTSEATTRK